MKDLINSVISRFNYIGTIARSDLEQVAQVAILEAQEKYLEDHESGAQFRSYAYRAIYNALQNYIIRNLNYITISPSSYRRHWMDLPDLTALSLETTYSERSLGPSLCSSQRSYPLKDLLPSTDPEPLDVLIRREQISVIHRELEVLPESCRSVLKRFWFDGESMASMARKSGVSRDAISQRARKGMKILRKKMKKC